MRRLVPRGWLVCGLSLLAPLSWSSLALGQEDIVAFGDSITEGPFPFDEEKRGGYPSRLQDILRASGMEDVKVHNEGLSGELISEGLSRIDSVLNQHKNAGTFVIMEGTNDVNRISRGEYSIETTIRNLEAMAAKVRAKAIIAMYSTIIPRPSWATSDRSNAVTFNLVFRIRELTSGGNRPLAEPWEVFESEAPPQFRNYYWCCDSVGHPNGAGFDLMAELFADRILGNDTLAPTVSSFTKTGTFGVLRAGDRLHSIVHESGEGIVKEETFFTLNGKNLATDVTGGESRLELDYQVDNKEIDCAARITVRTEDSAEPPNIRNRIIAEFAVNDATTIKGDVNGDCRVDGFDLSLLGFSFGSKLGQIRYSKFADTNNDAKVDGDDLAKLARNFGKSSSGS